jgi:hypothetical protein
LIKKSINLQFGKLFRKHSQVGGFEKHDDSWPGNKIKANSAQILSARDYDASGGDIFAEPKIGLGEFFRGIKIADRSGWVGDGPA